MAWFDVRNGSVYVQAGQGIDVPSGFAVVPVGPQIRLASAMEYTFDLGGKASYVKGGGIRPIAIAIGTAEGKLEIKCSNAFELSSACTVIGGVGSLIVVTINFVRDGMIPTGYLFMPAVWENGGGFEGKEADGFSDKLTVKFSDALKDGLSMYAQDFT